MSRSIRSGKHLIGGIRNDTTSPMWIAWLRRMSASIKGKKTKAHQGPPKAIAGTGGFKLKHKKK